MYAVFAGGAFEGLYKKKWQAQRLVDKLAVFNIAWGHSPRFVECDGNSTFDEIQAALFGEVAMPVGASRAIHILLERIELGRFGLTYANRGIFA